MSARHARPRIAIVGAMLAAGAGAVPAQQRTTPPRDTLPRTARDTVPRTARDSAARDSIARAARPLTRADSLRADSLTRDTALVRWAEPDSIMESLRTREGYTVTLYQGAIVRFNAKSRVLDLAGQPSAVKRGEMMLVGDSIIYDDSTKIVLARSAPGRVVTLRDPQTQGSGDLVVQGRITYDLERRRGTLTAFRTTSEEAGQQWVIAGETGAVVSDTSIVGGQRVYAHDGSITSCTDSVPHYHFASKDIKLVGKKLMVARPAVLYIGEIPVMWLPFVFQDMRSGRKSGMLTPRFGVAELLRNNPSYRRTVENIGWFFALSDYMDGQLSLDWRSSARPSQGDPGWYRYNGEWRYSWLNRFLSGRMSASYLTQRDGSTNTSVSWSHLQDFSQRSRLTMNLNYVTNTQLQRRNSINPVQALATIRSQLNYQTQIGPASLQMGGTRTQYPGRTQVDQDLPNLSISTQTISLAKWLDWTPSFNLTQQTSRRIDQGGEFNFAYVPRAGGGLDSVRINRGSLTRAISIETPIKLFDFVWNNSIRINDRENDFPETRQIVGVRDTSMRQTRVFAKTFATNIDWQTSFSLPRLLQGSWNLTPTISVINVDPSAGLLVRTELSNGRYVTQPKRLSYGLTASPTLFGLFPGFGPVARFRHSFAPSISWSYSPSANVSDEFLQATNRSRVGYLGALAQNQVSIGLNQNIEAKLRAPKDSSPDAGRKIRLLSLGFSTMSYDFVRRDTLKNGFIGGISTPTFSYNLRSDLLPGFDFHSAYSLFDGDFQSDSAIFKPYRTDLGLTFSLGPESGLIQYVSKLFGVTGPRGPVSGAAAPASTDGGRLAPGDRFFNQQAASMNAAGMQSRGIATDFPSSRGWNLNISYTAARSRPVTRGSAIIIDPRTACEPQRINPILYDECIARALTAPPAGTTPTNTSNGGPIFQSPPTQSVQAQTQFNITPKWAAQWSTNYDFVRKEFASHQVSLQRDLHDWRAIFAFTQSPNGNFAFNFFVALKAEPDLKFNYDRQTYRSAGGFR